MLSKTELEEDALRGLSLLARSPAWGLYVARLRELTKRHESEKAALLRDSLEGRETRASYLQGRVDGTQDAILELDRYLESLKPKETQEPAYL